ncbi:MAG: hypothetical protein ACO1NU_08735 [Arcticibacter sp.]
MDNLELNLDFILNNPQVREQLNDVRSGITGVLSTSRSASQQVASMSMAAVRQAAISQAQAVNSALSGSLAMSRQTNALIEDTANRAAAAAQEAAVRSAAANAQVERDYQARNERIRRSVAELNNVAYSARGGFNSLQNSINQISRELPAFTYSAQTGFMAVSNNIPILVDSLSAARKQNEALTASGQKAVPIWRQLTSSMLSWQTLLTVGITLTTVYGKEIGIWVKALFNGKSALDDLKQAKQNQIEVDKAYQSSITKEISNLQTLIQTANNERLSREKRVEAVRSINRLMPEHLGNITLEKIKTDESRVAIEKYIEVLKRKSYEEAINSKRQELLKQRIDLSEGYNEARDKRDQAAVAAKNQKFKINDEETATDALFKKRQASFEEYIEKDRAIMKQVETLDKGYQKRLEAEKPIGDSNKQDKSYFERIVSDNQLLLDNLDKSATDFVAKSKDYKAKIAEARKNLKAFTAEDPDKQSKKDGTDYDQIISGRKSILERIVQLDDEYSRKSFNKDEEELQALKDKFAKLQRIIAEENEKIAKYNATHSKKVSLVSTSGLDDLQKDAEADLKYRQQTEKLKVELDKQQKLYENFENARVKFGADKAKELYNVQFGSFSEYLSNQKANVNTTDAGSGPVEERNKILSDAMEKEAEAQAKHLSKLLEDFQSYQAQRKLLTENYERDYQVLLSAGKIAEANTRSVEYTESLRNLDDANVKKLDSYKKLFDGVERVSDKQAQVVIANAESMLQELQGKGLISADLAKDIIDKINDSKKAVADRLPDRLDAAADSLRNVASAISSIDDGFANVLGTVSNVIAGFSEMQRQKEAMNASGASGTEKLLAGAGMVTAGIGIAASVIGTGVSWFKGLKAAKEKAKADIKDFYDAAYRGEMQYQATLRDRARQQAEQHRDTMEGLKAEYELLTSQQTAIDKKYNEVYRKLQGEQYVESTTYKHGTWFRKAKSEQNMASLAGMDYDQLEELYLQGKLTEGAKSLFEWLQKLKEEGADVKDAFQDVADVASELATGTNVDSLTDGFMNFIKEGKTGVKDLADFFEDSMNEASLNMFKNNILKGKIEGFYKQFAEAGKDGLTTEDIEALRIAYQTMTGEALAEFEKLKQVTGSDFKTADGSAVSKGIQSITSDQASALEGITRGTYDYTKRNYQTAMEGLAVMKQQTEVLIRIERHAASSSLKLDALEKLDKLATIAEKLDKIVSNTNSGSLRGAGYG